METVLKLQPLTMENALKLHPLVLCLLLAGCSSFDHFGAGNASALSEATQVQLPLLSAWADGKPVRYITTDASTRAAAQKMQANFVPQLANAIPAEPRQPGQASTLARVYEISNFKQNNVFSSVPQPSGFANQNTDYSPLWRVHLVHWQAGKTPHLLNSEEAILAAEEKQEVQLERTDIVVNCPVLFSVPGGGLPGATPQGAAK